MWDQRLFIYEAADKDNHKSGEQKTDAGEQDLGCGIISADRKHTVAYLDAGKRTSP